MAYGSVKFDDVVAMGIITPEEHLEEAVPAVDEA